jgi:hypothetical protein
MLRLGGPAANRLEHFTLDLTALITNGGVMEGLEDVVDDLVHRNTGVLPGVENATE